MIPLFSRRTLSLCTLIQLVEVLFMDLDFPVTVAGGKHPFPFRTRQLSPPAPMVLRAKVRGRVGRCREVIFKALLARAFRFL
jgi:hypothetical protein